jgi:hypothetical protein
MTDRRSEDPCLGGANENGAHRRFLPHPRLEPVTSPNVPSVQEPTGPNLRSPMVGNLQRAFCSTPVKIRLLVTSCVTGARSQGPNRLGSEATPSAPPHQGAPLASRQSRLRALTPSFVPQTTPLHTRLAQHVHLTKEAELWLWVRCNTRSQEEEEEEESSSGGKPASSSRSTYRLSSPTAHSARSHHPERPASRFGSELVSLCLRSHTLPHTKGPAPLADGIVSQKRMPAIVAEGPFCGASLSLSHTHTHTHTHAHT